MPTVGTEPIKIWGEKDIGPAQIKVAAGSTCYLHNAKDKAKDSPTTGWLVGTAAETFNLVGKPIWIVGTAADQTFYVWRDF